MTATPRLALPFLSVGQAQKEFSHNEALQTLDVLVAGAVEEPPRSSPPLSPAIGACYVVDANATDAWVGKSQCVAAWTGGGWRFVQPLEGMCLHVRSMGVWMCFRGGNWENGMLRGDALIISGDQVVGPRLPPIADVTAGGTVDAEARNAIAAILGAMRVHGLIET